MNGRLNGLPHTPLVRLNGRLNELPAHTPFRRESKWISAAGSPPPMGIITQFEREWTVSDGDQEDFEWRKRSVSCAVF